MCCVVSKGDTLQLIPEKFSAVMGPHVHLIMPITMRYSGNLQVGSYHGTYPPEGIFELCGTVCLNLEWMFLNATSHQGNTLGLQV